MANNEAIITRIKKLLAKANDSAVTEEEALAYMYKVEELLEAHNLSKSDLENQAEVSGIDRTYVDTPYGHSPWRKVLVGAVATLFFCRGYPFSQEIDGKNKNTKWLFVGKAHNREVAVSMFEYLEKTVVRLANAYSKDQNERYHFAQGCGFRLTQRIYERNVERKRSKGETKNLPVLVRNELMLCDEYMSRDDITSSTSKVRRNSASIAGVQAANGISIDNQVSGMSGDTLRLKA